jgi:hypothetical protein
MLAALSVAKTTPSLTFSEIAIVMAANKPKEKLYTYLL